MNPISSRQVSWALVNEHVAERLQQVGSWPPAGTVSWAQLDDADPAKWAALLDAAQHWALKLELNQRARAEASRAVSAAADWSAIGSERLKLNSFYEHHPWLKRAGGGHV